MVELYIAYCILYVVYSALQVAQLVERGIVVGCVCGPPQVAGSIPALEIIER